jgi:uncharacterized protein
VGLKGDSLEYILGKDFSLDLNKLLSTRLLVQANSGGGKSWLLRKILEVTHGKVQQIVLDIEGDFSSLREKYDFILAGKDGDIPADPKSAELLARKILELKSDLIVDLYELKQPERIRFVRLFLEAMINAPKNLWGPVLVILDEAHIFAPEKGSSEAMGSVIDMATRGRKRGFCLVMATQRLSKLHKDAAAEMNNKLIGRTGLDIDMKRAADELGMLGKDSNQLRHLSPGEFFAFGPAISREVKTVVVGEVRTKHPKAGSIGRIHSPAPSSKVKSALAKLKDLPEEAKQELQEKSELKARIKELEAETKKRVFPKMGEKLQEHEIQKRVRLEVAKYRTDLEKQMKKCLSDLKAKMLEAYKAIPGGLQMPDLVAIKKIDDPTWIPSKNTVSIDGQAYTTVKIQGQGPPPDEKDMMKSVENMVAKSVSGLGACERKILGFLNARKGSSFTKVQVGAMTVYAHNSGGFNNALSRLNQLQLIHRDNGKIWISDTGAAVADTFQEVPHTLQDWISKLGACERKIYSLLLEKSEDTFSKEDIALRTQYAVNSGGFNNALSRLNTLGLIKRNLGMIKLNEDLIL